MRLAVPAVALLLAGCMTAAPPPAPPAAFDPADSAVASSDTGPEQRGCAPHEGDFARLRGGSVAEARAALARLPGIGAVRVAGPGDAVTMDFRPDRATVETGRDGRVLRVRCG